MSNKDGKALVSACEKLIMNYLLQNPSGSTNMEIARQTGLYLDVPSHKGYMTWTILEHFVQVGFLEKSIEGNRTGIYKLKNAQEAHNYIMNLNRNQEDLSEKKHKD